MDELMELLTLITTTKNTGKKYPSFFLIMISGVRS